MSFTEEKNLINAKFNESIKDREFATTSSRMAYEAGFMGTMAMWSRTYAKLALEALNEAETCGDTMEIKDLIAKAKSYLMDSVR